MLHREQCSCSRILMEAHSIQSLHHPHTGTRAKPLKDDDVRTTSMVVEVKKESNLENNELRAPLSPSINLGLQIGTNSAGIRNNSTATILRQGDTVLTTNQLHELEQQVLIHKHLAAGLCVPNHLLIPIRNSITRTFGSTVNGFPERYSSFTGFSSIGFDHKNLMDPEPGRCRRTDGKKWRCSWNTVPHQKYCERHIHRGRQRSRKPVEVSKIDTLSKSILLNDSNRDVERTIAAPATAISRSNIMNHHHPTYDFSKTFTDTITSSSSSTHGLTATHTTRMVPAHSPATCVTTIPSINPTTNSCINASCLVDSKEVCNMDFGEACRQKQIDFRSNNVNVQKIPSQGLGFSPNSVLQVSGCSSSCFDNKINIALEPGRCRRTDGKKWRCRRDVVPKQKYCELHMHRGSKKHKVPPRDITLLPSITTMLHNIKPATILNTNLSMSILAGEKQRQNEDKGNVSSSSETTVTDTTIAAVHENNSSKGSNQNL